MKLLLTNDDGITAQGLVALHESVQLWLRTNGAGNHQVIVIAPDRGRSECGHSISSGRKFSVSEVRPNWYAINGTPVDCVRVGLDVIAKDVDVVMSGVNAGANLGADLLVSGTYAAAKEGALAGRPSIAFSHYRRPEIDRTWEHVPTWTQEAMDQFDKARMRFVADDLQGVAPLWNVNLPAVEPTQASIPETRECDVDQNLMRREGLLESDGVSFESDFHSRPRDPGRDVDECFRGSITISKINARIG